MGMYVLVLQAPAPLVEAPVHTRVNAHMYLFHCTSVQQEKRQHVIMSAGKCLHFT